MTTPRELSQQQKLVITALADGRSPSAAARLAQCSRSSIRRWMALAHFREALEEAEAARIEKVQARLWRATDKAIVALEQIVDQEDGDPNVKVKAAQAILSGLARLRKPVQKVEAPVKAEPVREPQEPQPPSFEKKPLTLNFLQRGVGG